VFSAFNLSLKDTGSDPAEASHYVTTVSSCLHMLCIVGQKAHLTS